MISMVNLPFATEFDVVMRTVCCITLLTSAAVSEVHRVLRNGELQDYALSSQFTELLDRDCFAARRARQF